MTLLTATAFASRSHSDTEKNTRTFRTHLVVILSALFLKLNLKVKLCLIVSSFACMPNLCDSNHKIPIYLHLATVHIIESY